jgi:hypothetical protein
MGQNEENESLYESNEISECGIEYTGQWFCVSKSLSQSNRDRERELNKKQGRSLKYYVMLQHNKTR